MSYSSILEKQIDGKVGKEFSIKKKKMFGGVGYLLKGNVCFGIYQDFLILRISKEDAGFLLKKKGIYPFDITGRAVAGWVMIEPSLYQNVDSLSYYLLKGINYAHTLPTT